MPIKIPGIHGPKSSLFPFSVFPQNGLALIRMTQEPKARFLQCREAARSTGELGLCSPWRGHLGVPDQPHIFSLF